MTYKWHQTNNAQPAGSCTDDVEDGLLIDGAIERNPKPSSEDLLGARRALSQFIRDQAQLTASELGFGWYATDDAPKSLTQLRDEFHECRRTGRQMRVLKGFSEDTIFDCPSTNWAMRYWHDTRHVWLGADFTTGSELQVAACHLAVAKHVGHGPGSLVYVLLYADTVGQTLYVARTKRFVVHQLEFALDVVNFGLSTAIREEVERSTFDATAS